MASAAVIVDFTTTGPQLNINDDGFVFSSEDINMTGVSFDVTASAVIPADGPTFAGGDIARQNGGLGSLVENDGPFFNVIGGVSEVLRFTVGPIVGLQAGQSLQVTALLSQNGSGGNAGAADSQGGGFGGTFGQNANDSVTLTSDDGTTAPIPQSDAGDLGAILLNTDNGNTGNTGNTFSHPVSAPLAFTNFFDIAQTDLTRNDAIVIQGFEFAVVPEPSTSLLALFGGLGLILVRKRRA